MYLSRQRLFPLWLFTVHGRCPGLADMVLTVQSRPHPNNLHIFGLGELMEQNKSRGGGMTFISNEILKAEKYPTVGEGFESNFNKKGEFWLGAAQMEHEGNSQPLVATFLLLDTYRRFQLHKCTLIDRAVCVYP